MGIVGRVEANGIKLAIVEVEGPRYSLRDVSHGETDCAGTVDGIGRVLANPYATLEGAMRIAHERVFGVRVMLAPTMSDAARAERAREDKAVQYADGNERILGAGADES